MFPTLICDRGWFYFYLFMALLGLRLCAGFSLVAASGAFCLVVIHGLLTAEASPVWEHRPRYMGFSSCSS